MATKILDVQGLQLLYGEACKHHGVAQRQSMLDALAKTLHQEAVKEPLILELTVEQMTPADLLPVVDVFLLAKDSSVDMIDLVLNKRADCLNGLLVLQLLRAAEPKLRTVDLKDCTLRRETLREIFGGGLSCQNLNFTNARVRKLNMLGQFHDLLTLKLDFTHPVTYLPEGCFQGMPKLERLSMCGTLISNLWTTTAALSKLSKLIELRFQMCLCCQGTGQCENLPSNDYLRSWVWQHHGLSGRAPMLEAGTSFEAERYDTPIEQRSELDDFDAWFLSDDDSGLNYQEDFSYSGESYAESEMDSQPEATNLPMEVTAEDADHHVDVDIEREAALFLSFAEDVARSNAASVVDPSEESAEITQFPDNSSVVEELVEGSFDSSWRWADQTQLSPRGVDSLRTEHARDTNWSHILPTSKADDGDGSSGADEQELKTSLPSRARGAHAAPICFKRHYREFMLVSLPHLEVLDNVAVKKLERDKAGELIGEHYERLPNNRMCSENLIKVLKRREIGGWGLNGLTNQRRRRRMVVSDNGAVAIQRSLSAAKLASCPWPAMTPVCRSISSDFDRKWKCRPRQFEYHPTDPVTMVIGTLHGEVIVVNHESDKVLGYIQSKGAPCSILGLCWLNKDPSKLIAGSDNGALQLYDVNYMHTSVISSGESSSTMGMVRNRYVLSNGESRRRESAIYTYDDFEHLTSVHINSTDDYFLASGYSNDVGLYDLRTGVRLQLFNDLHQKHINVVKFAHHSPFLFATSSFDREIKMWDFRESNTRPLYTVRSDRGNVMVCFSRDDHYLLSSAVDNEVRQYLAVDGRLHTKFDIEPRGSSQNYTRSYYMNGRDYIISGSCEENVIRVCGAQTGRHLKNLSLEGCGLKRSLYVQSLRGDPLRDFHFSVLVAYNIRTRPEIMKVNMLASNTQGNDWPTTPAETLEWSMGQL